MSQACLGKSTFFYIGHSQYGQSRIAIEQCHMTILRAHVSTHRGDVIYLEALR